MSEEAGTTAASDAEKRAKELATRAALKEDMRSRALQIQRLGVEIGLFEWIVWSSLAKCPVLLLMGDAIVNVSEVFGQGLGLNTEKPPCRAIAVSWNHDFDLWVSDSST